MHYTIRMKYAMAMTLKRDSDDVRKDWVAEELGGFMRARRRWRGRMFHFEVGEEGKWFRRKYLYHAHVFLLVDSPETPDQLFNDIRSFWKKNSLPFDPHESLKWMFDRRRLDRSISGWHNYIRKRDQHPIIVYSDFVFDYDDWPCRMWFLGA